MKRIILSLVIFFSFLIVNTIEAKEIKFAQISDTHLSIDGEDYRGRNVSQSAEYLKKAVKDINKRHDIDFVIFTGDNIDVANRDELKVFFRIARKLHKKYYMIVGDHDVFRYEQFGKKEYMHTVWLYHPQMLFKGTNYVFKPSKDIVVIVVDGANELFLSPSGYFKQETLEWLDKQLYKYKNKKVIIAQHFPLIPPAKKYSHNTVDVDKYFDILHNHDNVIAVISGHFHAANQIYKKGIYHISAPAFVSEPFEYSIITLDYNPKYLFANPSEFSIKSESISAKEKTETVEFKE
jgi:3',5'-cyclic AMP phosphodiesterase CpdA